MALEALPNVADEIQRRDACAGLRNILSGCAVLDQNVMQGGFERGTVVGISAETVDSFGEVVRPARSSCPSLVISCPAPLSLGF